MRFLKGLNIDPDKHLTKSLNRLDQLALGSSIEGGQELLKTDEGKLNALRLHMLVAGKDLTLPEDVPAIPSGGRGYAQAIEIEFTPPPKRIENTPAPSNNDTP